jgi:ceramide glucosyltransferase
VIHSVLNWLVLAPVVFGSIYSILCSLAVLRFMRSRRQRAKAQPEALPPVTILKPVCGLEKNLAENLRSACEQDYPEFQVVFSVQDPGDPALPMLRELQREFGPERVTVAAGGPRLGSNGKINNLGVGLPNARHEILVISDSDVRLRPDYLATIVAPLADPGVGFVCTLYRAACAERWYEKLELLTLNAEFIPDAIFATVTGAARICLGASTALRRATLEAIGGLAALANYLVEDHEMGRAIRAMGKRGVVLPYCVETMVDLQRVRQWWDHLVYWDQNTLAANPSGFAAAVSKRALPFALLFALLRGLDPLGLGVLLGACGVRLASAALALGPGLGDREGLPALALLPLRDVVGLASWVAALAKRRTIWRGAEFELDAQGRLTACAAPARRLIVTGDDFGLALPVNEAIEEAYRRGVLTSASLMVGAPAAADAVERARRNPGLRVGLHVVLAEGRAVLGPDALPDLVDARGEFGSQLVRAGFRFFFLPRARRQLSAEIRAQFEAFSRTGLALDHVDGHNHLHLHPTVLRLLLEIGREFGMTAMRLPVEPWLPSWRAARTRPLGRLAGRALLLPWTAWLRWRLRHAGVRCNDFVFGLNDSGQMRSELVVRLLERLPEGVTEIYFHPATRRCAELERSMPDYQHVHEFAALVSPSVREAVRASGALRMAYAEL